MKSILYDATLCVGCLSCVDACDNHNSQFKRKWSEEKHADFRKPIDGLSADKWLHISHHTPVAEGEAPVEYSEADARKAKYMKAKNITFTRHACMHCLNPGCVSACIVGALTKLPDGPVIYNKDKCIGCRYCMLACPFSIPKWEWHESLPYIRKCTMCSDKLFDENGKAKEDKSDWIPSCVQKCPFKAIKFGDRDELFYEALKRIQEDKTAAAQKGQSPKYYPHVFGAEEVGGTSVLYLTRLEPSKVGLPGNLSTRPIPNYAESPMSTVPYWVGGLGAMLGGFYWLVKRRDKIMNENSSDAKGDN